MRKNHHLKLVKNLLFTFYPKSYSLFFPCTHTQYNGNVKKSCWWFVCPRRINLLAWSKRRPCFLHRILHYCAGECTLFQTISVFPYVWAPLFFVVDSDTGGLKKKKTTDKAKDDMTWLLLCVNVLHTCWVAFACILLQLGLQYVNLFYDLVIYVFETGDCGWWDAPGLLSNDSCNGSTMNRESGLEEWILVWLHWMCWCALKTHIFLSCAVFSYAQSVCYGLMDYDDAGGLHEGGSVLMLDLVNHVNQQPVCEEQPLLFIFKWSKNEKLPLF